MYLTIKQNKKRTLGIHGHHPVHLSTEHKDRFAHCKIKLEKGLVAINPRFDYSIKNCSR
jgi:hypothetical protein